MNRVVSFTDRATRDFDETLTWYRRQSRDAAEKWIDAVDAVIEQLETGSEVGSLAPESERLQLQLLQIAFVAGRKLSHRMVFAIRDHAVTVYAIRHLARGELVFDELS